jgi:voltage-gated potassium channel
LANFQNTKFSQTVLRFKGKLRRFISSSWFNLPIAALILVSVVLVFAEFFIPAGQERDEVILFSNFITYIFIVELVLRYWVAPIKRIFFANFWVDILSVLPVLRIFRAFRLLRLLRLFRLARAVTILLKDAGWLSARLERGLGHFTLLLMTSLILVFCATLALLTFGSRNADGVISWDIFLDKAWYAAFLFVNGEFIGDFPTDMASRFVLLLTSVSGLVVFAVLVGTISASMTAYFKTKMDTKDLRIKDLRDHLIICGWDSTGRVILSELERVRETWDRGVIVVAQTESDIADEAGLRDTRRLFHVKEDFTKMSVLSSIGLEKARTAIVLADKGNNLSEQDRDARTVLAALTIEKLNPKIFTCAELLDEQNATHLKIAGVEEIISRTSITAGLFASTAINSGVTAVIRDILTHKEGSYFKKIPVPDNLAGKTFIEAFNFFKLNHEATIIALEKPGLGHKYEQQVNPDSKLILKSSDKLVLILKIGSNLSEF